MIETSEANPSNYQVGGDGHFIVGMLGVHAMLLLALVVTLGWLSPGLLLPFYLVFVSRGLAQAVCGVNICLVCSNHRWLLLVVAVFLLALDFGVMRWFLAAKRRTACLCYALAAVFGIAVFQSFILYGVGCGIRQIYDLMVAAGT